MITKINYVKLAPQIFFLVFSVIYFSCPTLARATEKVAWTNTGYPAEVYDTSITTVAFTGPLYSSDFTSGLEPGGGIIYHDNLPYFTNGDSGADASVWRGSNTSPVVVVEGGNEENGITIGNGNIYTTDIIDVGGWGIRIAPLPSIGSEPVAYTGEISADDLFTDLGHLAFATADGVDLMYDTLFTYGYNTGTGESTLLKVALTGTPVFEEVLALEYGSYFAGIAYWNGNLYTTRNDETEYTYEYDEILGEIITGTTRAHVERITDLNSPSLTQLILHEFEFDAYEGYMDVKLGDVGVIQQDDSPYVEALYTLNVTSSGIELPLENYNSIQFIENVDSPTTVAVRTTSYDPIDEFHYLDGIALYDITANLGEGGPDNSNVVPEIPGQLIALFGLLMFGVVLKIRTLFPQC